MYNVRTAHSVLMWNKYPTALRGLKGGDHSIGSRNCGKCEIKFQINDCLEKYFRISSVVQMLPLDGKVIFIIQAQTEPNIIN